MKVKITSCVDGQRWYNKLLKDPIYKDIDKTYKVEERDCDRYVTIEKIQKGCCLFIWKEDCEIVEEKSCRGCIYQLKASDFCSMWNCMKTNCCDNYFKGFVPYDSEEDCSQRIINAVKEAGCSLIEATEALSTYAKGTQFRVEDICESQESLEVRKKVTKLLTKKVKKEVLNHYKNAEREYYMTKLKKVVKESPKNTVSLCEVNVDKVYGAVISNEIHIITRVFCGQFVVVPIENSGRYSGSDSCSCIEDAVKDCRERKNTVYEADDIFTLIEGLKNLK